MNRRNMYHQRTIVLTAVALMMLLGATSTDSLAYFTTYVTAKGGYEIELREETELRETFDNWTKSIEIENSGEVECYVRVKAFAGSQVELVFSSSSWRLEEDGYYYYNEILEPGQTTEELRIDIQVAEEVKMQSQTFDVIVVHESTRALYHENGEPYADWTMKLEEAE